MGLFLEEVEENQSMGVRIANMAGSVAQASKRGEADVCIGDVLASIDDVPCDTLTFDQVMTLLANSPDPIRLTFRRDASLIAVRFAQTGAAVAVPPGTPLKQLATLCRAQIPFSCSTGDCATCEQTMRADNDDDTNIRYIRPCVARVPKGNRQITIIPSESYLFGVPPPF